MNDVAKPGMTNQNFRCPHCGTVRPDMLIERNELPDTSMGDLVQTTIFCGGKKRALEQPTPNGPTVWEPCGAIFSVTVQPNVASIFDRARAAGLQV